MISTITIVFLSLFSWIYLLDGKQSLAKCSFDAQLFRELLPLFIILLGVPIYLLGIADSFNYLEVSVSLGELLLASVLEETLYRAILLGTLLTAGIRPVKAIILSSVVFSLLHGIYQPSMDWSILHLFMDTLIVGLTLNVIYFKSSNLPLVIVIHFAWNASILINRAFPHEEITFTTTVLLILIKIMYLVWSVIEIRKPSKILSY